MKKFYFVFVSLLLLVSQLKAQAPNSLNFQGVVRNNSGIVLPNQAISLRFSIRQGSPTGAIVYRETQSATSNSLGLFAVGVGSGTVVNGNFSSIDWAHNTEFLQVEMDPTGGSSYLDMGTNQYLSVPYAISAASTSSEWKLTGTSATTATNYIGTTDGNDLVFKTNGDELMRMSSSSGNVGVGTNNPNIGAELDINSSSKGFLIPRMTANPVNPAQGMMYYNTSNGCFMYYSGTSWNTMTCPCPNALATPGPITSSYGSGNFCASQTGVIYSVAPVSNATSYTWNAPFGATITAGQGSNAITLTTGTANGTISVSATNNCGTSAASSLAVTVGAGAIIATQPVNTGATTTSAATFSVGVTTGGGDTYQWQVSTNGGSTYNNVTNAGVYSGATTPNLTITNPPVTMNGYIYQVIVTAVCGTPASVTSNAATLSVCNGATPSLPITFTNSQSTPTAANLAVQITGLNFSAYSGYENTNLSNIKFTTGPAGTGSPLYAWIENGSQATVNPATTPTSSSTAAVVWVNLGSNLISASGGTLTIYMSFAASPVMTGTTGYTGMAPELSASYGQFDNGALVFSTFYDNFAGTSLSPLWTSFSSGSIAAAENNGFTVSTGSSTGTNVITSATNYPAPIIAETYALGSAVTSSTRSYMPGLTVATASGEGANVADNTSTTGYMTISNGRNGSGTYTTMQGTGGSSVTYPASISTPAGPTGYNVWGLGYTASTNAFYENYNTLATSNATTPTGNLYLALGLGTFGNVTSSIGYNWVRLRVYPPAGILPTTAIGVFGCY